jgi:hypothetical protein
MKYKQKVNGMRMMNAYTEEIDEVDDAVAQIMSQLDMSALGEHSVGIVSLYRDFIETGVLKALAGALPFEIVGITTMASASQEHHGMYRLGLTVLTGDDVSFAVSCSGAITGENCDAELAAAWQNAREKAGDNFAPSFIIAFFSIVPGISTAEILRRFDAVCGGLPIWGGVSSDTGAGFNKGRVVRGADARDASLGMILVSGNVQPDFIVSAFPERCLDQHWVVITESAESTIKRVNDMTFREYFRGIGLNPDVEATDASAPVLLDYGDGSAPTMLGIYRFLPDGGAMTGGNVPVGAKLCIGEIDMCGVMESAGNGLEKMRKIMEGKNGALLMPCTTHYLMLAPQSDNEIELVESKLKGKLTHSLSYVAGEVCPVKDKSGAWRNRMHNFSFSACIF